MDPLKTVASTMDVVKATSATYEALQRPTGLPNEFKQVGRSLPLVLKTLRRARDRLKDVGTSLDRPSRDALDPPISLCMKQAKMLRDVFDKVYQGVKDQSAKDRSVLDLYRNSLGSLGKAHRVEKLMGGILKNLDALATNQLLRTATQDLMAQLKEAMEQLSKVESSVPDLDTDGSMNNSQNIDSGGTGYMSNITGQGHYINPGSGRQFNAQTMSFGAGPREDCKTRRDMMSALHKLPYQDGKNMNPKAVQGTCAWFVGHHHFQRWRESTSSSMLWVSAYPGSGKSVLARHLVDKELESTETRTVCYFFFKEDFELERSATSALSCLLHQLFSRRQDLVSDQIVEKYDYFRAHLTDSLESLWEVLIMASQNQSAGQIVCVLDALDECDDQERDMLARLLRAFYSNEKEGKTSLKFLITSRPYDKVGLAFDIPGLPIIHLKVESEAERAKIGRDIDIYIQDRVSRIRASRNLAPDEEDLLLTGLRKVPNQTYLWVTLTLNLIEADTGIDKDRIRDAMLTLPQTVDDAYEKMLSKSTNPEEAKKLLHMVVAAARPLTLLETNVAMCLGPDHGSYRDWDHRRSERFERHVRDLCGLLVTITGSKVYLLHQTAKEFLVGKDDADSGAHHEHEHEHVWRRSLHPTESHALLFNLCSRHLLSDNCGSHHVGQCCGAHILLDYSATNWPAHFHASGLHGDDVVDTLQKICDARSEACQTWLTTYWRSTRTDFPRGFTTLMIASYFGLERLVQIQLDMGDVDSDARDETYQRSALSWASERGHDAVVRLLLEGPKTRLANLVRGPTRDWTRLPRLWWRDITDLSLSRSVEIDSKDEYGRTPLSYAALHGHGAVVERLIQAGARADVKDDIGGTPISYASVSRHEAVAEIMRTGAPADSADKNGPALLTSAAGKGREDDVRLLLDYGVDIESRDERGSTPLQSAAHHGRDAIAKLLLDRGASVDSKDNNAGSTPLHLAASQGHETVVTLLLGRGARIDSGDQYGQMPLHLAARNGHEAIVELLVEKGAGVDLADQYSQMPLHLAASQGHETVVTLLLDRGASIDSGDQYGQMPLHLTARNGHEAIVKILLDEGAGVDLKDKYRSQTPLHFAAENGNEAIVELLLDEGADVDARAKQGETPLWAAAERNREAAAWLLLERGARVDSRDHRGQTPLRVAADGNHEAVARLLLERGAQADSENELGETPLHAAAKRGHHTMAKMLAAAGAGT